MQGLYEPPRVIVVWLERLVYASVFFSFLLFFFYGLRTLGPWRLTAWTTVETLAGFPINMLIGSATL